MYGNLAYIRFDSNTLLFYQRPTTKAGGHSYSWNKSTSNTDVNGIDRGAKSKMHARKKDTRNMWLIFFSSGAG